MDSRPSVIERAAALLRNTPASTAPNPDVPLPEPTRPIVPPRPSMKAPLKRTHTLDRAHLAQAGIIMPWSTTARVVEEFRIVKRRIMTNLQAPEQFEQRVGVPRTVMVTSSKPREGKTFTSINLALAFAAEENLTTILVDADPVRGDIARRLKTDIEPGLTGILSGEVKLEDALIQTDLPNLILLPPGAHSPHVPELLSSRGPSLIAALAARYPEHVIILDNPPCLASSDPAALAPIVSQVVFVVEAGQTQRNEIETSVSLISACRHINFLLNKTPPSAGQHFGAYSYYYTPQTAAMKVGVD